MAVLVFRDGKRCSTDVRVKVVVVEIGSTEIGSSKQSGGLLDQ